MEEIKKDKEQNEHLRIEFWEIPYNIMKEYFKSKKNHDEKRLGVKGGQYDSRPRLT